MIAYCYENTKTNIPNWEATTHQLQKFGYGYEAPNHFVHFYGKEVFYIISSGLTVIEEKSGTYEEWISSRFGAVNIKRMRHKPGVAVKNIWRPALYRWDDIDHAIQVDPAELRSQEQALRTIIEKLDQILLYIEPSSEGLESFGHKTRELLILACTEVENQWTTLLSKCNYTPANGKILTTQDYVKLLPVTHLSEYQISLRNYSSPTSFSPFKNWSAKCPTKSLPWYDAYNKTKHSRDTHFSESKLKYAIDAVAANIALYAVRFGVLRQIHDTSHLSGLIKHIFEMSMINSDRTSFYLPELLIPDDIYKGCQVIDSYGRGLFMPWRTQSFSI